MVSRLVQQQQLRLPDQRPRQCYPFAPATGQLRHGLIGRKLQLINDRVHFLAQIPALLGFEQCLHLFQFSHISVAAKRGKVMEALQQVADLR